MRIPTTSCVAEDVSGNVQVFPHNQCLDRTKLETLERVVDTEAVFAGVLADLVEVTLDELLLLDELDVRERLGGEFNGLDMS